MSALQDSLNGLLTFLEKAGQAPPTQDVWVLELGTAVGVDDRGRIRVKRADYRDPTDYEARFQELLVSSLPWINVSCYGMDDRKLVVTVEIPGNSARQANRTSINYSGPPKAVSDHGWDASEALAIE